MTVLNARASRFGVDNTVYASVHPSVDDHFVADGPYSDIAVPFTNSLFHYDIAHLGGAGHGWYKGSGFTFSGAPGAITPTGGTVTSISADFLGGSSADYSIYDFSLSLVDLFNGDYTYLLNNLWNGNDKLKGSDFDDQLHGGNGDDVLTGYAGNDSLYGGQGNDFIHGGSGDDFILGNGNNDTLYGGRGEDSIFGQSGNDKMRGGKGGDLLDGGIGDDVLHGDRGADQMFGKEGNDRLIGGTGADEMHGGDDNDVLFGGGHNDNLYGEDGDDVLDGGIGQDYMNGGTGNDTYYVNETLDEIVEATGAGTDKVVSTASLYTLSANVENLTLHADAAHSNGIGNALGNTIKGNDSRNYIQGLDGDDFLFGNGHDDILVGGKGDDYLDGGSDKDDMFGGKGNDRYILRDIGDTITEVFGEGTDTVISHLSQNLLAANVENMRLHENAGTTSSANGNSLDNRLYGNSLSNHLNGSFGNDRLFGGAGNDLLYGGEDNDYLVGGADSDNFLFSFVLNNGHDVIMDFLQGVDTLVFSGWVLADLTISSQGSGILIEYGAAESVFLEGVGAITLGAADFSFI